MLPLTSAYGDMRFGMKVPSSTSLERCILQCIEINSLLYLNIVLQVRILSYAT